MSFTPTPPLACEPVRVAANEPVLSPEMDALAQAVATRVVEGLRAELAGVLGRPAVPNVSTVPSPEPEWLTSADAARYLGMKPKAFYSAVARRQVPASRLGRRLRFNRVGLDRLLLQRQTRAVQRSPRVPSPGK